MTREGAECAKIWLTAYDQCCAEGLKQIGHGEGRARFSALTPDIGDHPGWAEFERTACDYESNAVVPLMDHMRNEVAQHNL